MESRARVAMRGVGKDYVVGEQTLVVLRDVDLDIAPGEALVITGPSGSGKSTLLHLLGTLERPTRGTLSVGDRDLAPLDDAELAEFRNRDVGFIFQDHHLLPQFDVLQNVLMPTLATASRGAGAEGKIRPGAARERARALLSAVGLEQRLDHRPAQLSGGERQRAAIARALINEPLLLLCDEPTGNLDADTAHQVTQLLFDLHANSGASLVTVTHSEDLAARFPRRLRMSSGDVLDTRAAS